MRDVATLTPGELVYVHSGENVHASGTFLSNDDGVIVVDHIDSISRTPLTANDPWVTDLDGEVVGAPEPPLPTLHPELE